MRKRLASVVVVIAACAWGVTTLTDEDDPKSSAGVRSESTADAQRSGPRQGRLNSNALDNEVSIAAGSSRPPPGQSAVAPLPRSDSRDVDDRIATERIAQELRARLSYEEPDPDWAIRAETKLREFVGNLPPAIAVVEATDCRTTMCVLDVTHHAQPAREEFLAQAEREGIFDVEVFAAFLDTRDELRTRVFLSREGYDLDVF